jgi:uncharacterized membrane protein
MEDEKKEDLKVFMWSLVVFFLLISGSVFGVIALVIIIIIALMNGNYKDTTRDGY